MSIKNIKKMLSKIGSNTSDSSILPHQQPKGYFKKIALFYESKGLGVLPLKITDKEHIKPVIAFRDRPNLSKEQINQIWNKNPYYNIAILARKIFFVDIDSLDHHEKSNNNHESDNINGFDIAQELENKHGEDLFKDTLTTLTTSNGVHLWYLKPDDLKLGQKVAFFPKIDIKGHENNYCIAPPTELIDGTYYRFLNHLPIKEPSPKLIQLIKAKQVKHYTKGYQPKALLKDRGSIISCILHGFGDEGTRNNNCFKLASKLMYLNTDFDDVWSFLIEANNHTANPLSEKEIYNTYKSAEKYELRKYGLDK